MLLLLVFFVFWIAAGGELGIYAAFATTARPSQPANPGAESSTSNVNQGALTGTEGVGSMTPQQFGSTMSGIGSFFNGIYNGWSNLLTGGAGSPGANTGGTAP